MRQKGMDLRDAITEQHTKDEWGQLKDLPVTASVSVIISYSLVEAMLTNSCLGDR